MKTKELNWWIFSMRINLPLRQMTRNHQSWPLRFPIILTSSIKPLRQSLAPTNSYLPLIPIFNQTLTKILTNPNKHQNPIRTKNTSKQCHVIIALSIWKDLSSSRSRKTQNNILSNFQPSSFSKKLVSAILHKFSKANGEAAKSPSSVSKTTCHLPAPNNSNEKSWPQSKSDIIPT